MLYSNCDDCVAVLLFATVKVLPVTNVSVTPVISTVTSSFLVNVIVSVTSLYVPPVTNVFVEGGIETSTLIISPMVLIDVLEPPLSVLKYKSVPDLPLNISSAPPELTPFSILLSNSVCKLTTPEIGILVKPVPSP